MDTKTKLLDCAEHLARARGIDGFSYADMAQEIAIRKASIHYHFATKSDLSLALITRYSDNFTSLLSAIDDKKHNAAQALQSYINLYRDALGAGDTICLCIAFSVAKESLSDDVMQQLKLFRAKNIKWLTAQFETAKTDDSVINIGNPEAEAYACLANVEGAHVMARSAQDLNIFDKGTALLKSRLR